MEHGIDRQRARIVAATLATTLAFSLVAPALKQPAEANTFVYRPGYQRFNRYVYRGHTWLRVGFFGAAAPGFYPSIGYLGFAPPPLYAVPPPPGYGYPVPYVYPVTPYAFAPAIVPYCGPLAPYYSGPPLPIGAAFFYRGAYLRRSLYGGYRRDDGYRGYYRRSDNGGYRGHAAPPYSRGYRP